jgi:ABC-type oligopeptide transport system, periplasmic component
VGARVRDLPQAAELQGRNGPQSSQLVPEAAAGFPRVTNNGKTYDFTVKAGFTKFSNGQPVTAANFKAAFDRDADPKMQSPAVSFFSDVVGSTKSPVSGVKVKGNHLIINLSKPAPDFEARVAMPFFCAIPTNLAHDPNGVLAPPSAGPYYIASRTPNKSILVKRNPNYHGPRPHNIAAINYTGGPDARRVVPPRPAGHERLRRERHPAGGLCAGRAG